MAEQCACVVPACLGFFGHYNEPAVRPKLLNPNLLNPELPVFPNAYRMCYEKVRVFSPALGPLMRGEQRTATAR